MNELSPSLLIHLSLAAALLPILIGVSTCYLKLHLVFSGLKHALGLQGVPTALTVSALSLTLSALVMQPVVEAAASEMRSAMAKGSSSTDAFSAALGPWREFMMRHTGRREIETLAAARANGSRGAPVGADTSPAIAETVDAPALPVLLPAFILSELRAGFEIVIAVMIPFLVIDLVIANLLAGLGLYMVSPMLIGVPLKVIFFAATDGWLVLSRNLVLSYGV